MKRFTTPNPGMLAAGIACLNLACVTAAGSQPVTMPPEIAAFTPTNLQTYYVAFLKEPQTRVPMDPELFRAHQDYMRAQADARRYILMGPFTDDGVVRGIVIVQAVSYDEARTLVGGDPAVKAGVFEIEVRRAALPDLSAVVVRYR